MHLNASASILAFYSGAEGKAALTMPSVSVAVDLGNVWNNVPREMPVFSERETEKEIYVRYYVHALLNGGRFYFRASW